ncbi:hypothetical protein [Pedobacter arcticus]|uniref:hypothetical protein n=1 Tax=Pedobacter arcticus TaxID=752140 RepID=UPI0002D7703C|nr:hypothetical protein [Pedobacter arcticus]
MFLTIQELKTIARQEHIQVIAGADDLIIQECVNSAITEVRSRLTPSSKREAYDGRTRYDVDALFAQTGEERNPLILAYTKLVAMWHLIVRGNAGVQYETIEARYDRAIEYLKDLASGDATDLTLPILPEPTEAESINKTFRMGSRPKFNHE